MRVANLRKHQILQPTIRLVVTAVDSITPSNYIFEHLKVDSLTAQVREGRWFSVAASAVLVRWMKTGGWGGGRGLGLDPTICSRLGMTCAERGLLDMSFNQRVQAKGMLPGLP